MAKPGKKVRMPTLVAEQCGLAVAYAEDGAYHSAARVLRELLADVEAHAAAVHGVETGAGNG